MLFHMICVDHFLLFKHELVACFQEDALSPGLEDEPEEPDEDEDKFGGSLDISQKGSNQGKLK